MPILINTIIMLYDLWNPMGEFHRLSLDQVPVCFTPSIGENSASRSRSHRNLWSGRGLTGASRFSRREPSARSLESGVWQKDGH